MPARCVICAGDLQKTLVDELGMPLTRSEIAIFLRETNLEKRRISCRLCAKTCFVNERERVPYSKLGRCSDCGGDHMTGTMERIWLFRAKVRLVCPDHPIYV